MRRRRRALGYVDVFVPIVRQYRWLWCGGWFGRRLALIASHGDRVDNLPEGARILAGNETCPVGFVAIGDNILTTQLHPEWTREYAILVYNSNHRKRVGDAIIDPAIKSLARPNDSDKVRDLITDFFKRPRCSVAACAE